MKEYCSFDTKFGIMDEKILSQFSDKVIAKNDVRVVYYQFFFSINGTHFEFFMRSGSPIPPDYLLLGSAPNLGPLISRWEINKFENC